jgi:Protein of unknown function (DUF4197)
MHQSLFNRRSFVLTTAATILASSSLSGCAGMGGLGGVNLVEAIKQLLLLSTQRGLGKLAGDGGFLNNAAAKIGMGDVLNNGNMGTALAVLNQLGVLNGVENGLNRAAEQAAGKIAPWVADGVKGMSISDAASIVNGPGDAATNLLKTAIGNKLQTELGGLVGGALQALNVLGPLMGAAGINLGGLNLGDLTRGVTQKAGNAIFGAIADEERFIRANPAATGNAAIIAAFGRG